MSEDPEICCGLRTNNVGEYFEGPKKMIEMFDGGRPKRCQIAMDCRGLVGKANLPKRKVETIFTQLRKWSQRDLIKS